MAIEKMKRTFDKLFRILKSTLCSLSILLAVMPLPFICGGCNSLAKNSDAIHIAIVVPEKKLTGISQIRGAQLYVGEVNSLGGVDGKNIVLDIYDDQDDVQTAVEMAEKVGKSSRAVAVIGHIRSNISSAAGEMYKTYKIPAVTAGSTGDQVTLNNDWYFRTVFNNSAQGRFLAYYTKNILKRNSVCIIREDPQQSSGIAEIFKDVAEHLHLQVTYDQIFDKNHPDLENILSRIVRQLSGQVGDSAIFIGAHAEAGAKLVALLKDAGIKNPIIGPTAFATQEFQNKFAQYPKEQATPGYYTNGLFVAVPLIFDTANKQANILKDKYREKYAEAEKRSPDWHTAFSYDAAKVIIDAVDKTDIALKSGSTKEKREKIRNYLAGLNKAEKAIKGATGLNYFDEHGNCPKPITIGVYRNKNLISALTQLSPVVNLNMVSNLEKEIEKKRILKFQKCYMYKTNVVYSGIEINNFSELDIKAATCLIDFYLWFRYVGDFDARNIMFTNAVTPIVLECPSKKKGSETADKSDINDTGLAAPEDLDANTGKGGSLYNAALVKQLHEGETKYLLYHVKARFRIMHTGSQISSGASYIIGFRFRHHDLSRDNLIYVTDVIGMGLAGEDTFRKQLSKDAVIGSASGWNIQDVYFYQNIESRNCRGEIRYLDSPNKFIDFSQFNFGVKISHDSISFRRKMSAQTADHLSLICLIAMIVLIILYCRKSFGNNRVIWFIQACFALMLLLASEVSVLNFFQESNVSPKVIVFTFNILWWIIPAVYLLMSLQAFIWDPIEKQTGRPLPKVFQKLAVYIVLFITAYGITVYVFEVNINKLMATSGAVAMVVGLLVKGTIANFFAGISIIQDYAVQIGQWVKISGFDEGRVEEITKRVTRIRTREGVLFSIPNSVVLGSTIHNYGDPDDVYWTEFTLETVPDPSPEKVMQVLKDAVMATNEVLNKDPEPIIIFKGQGDSSAVYTVRFAAMDYGKKPLYLTAVWNNVWRYLKNADIRLATPHRVMHMINESDSAELPGPFIGFGEA